METPFRAVSFKKGTVITRDKMNQLQSDYQWINDNTPRGRLFRADDSVRETRLVLIAGRKHISRDVKRDTQKVSVNFGRAFDPHCKPNITTGINIDWQKKVFCRVNGPRGINLPNSDGFEILVEIAADKEKRDVIKKDFYVHWSAFGFRRNDLNEF